MIEKVEFGGNVLIDITTREWHQCPTAVRNYLDYVTYDPTDYTTSQIAAYAPARAVANNTKPVGSAVNGTTHYNEVPNIATPIVSGAVKPLDRLRWMNTATVNVRDLGGWACDGGTVKYGMLFRGGEPNVADKDFMVNQIGIKHELQLRGNEAPNSESVWGIGFSKFDSFHWYSIADKPLWKAELEALFDCINHNRPVYFHCSAGADRTGTFACIVEALLGVSQSDIDKDYELTTFAFGSDTDANARRRNESEWQGLINAIKAVPLEGGLTDSFRNRAVSFVLSLGFTIAEINAFRTAMINGNPSAIAVSMDNYTVTKSGSHITFDNSASSVNEFQEYEINLRAESGYAVDSVTVTMGGVDVTSQVFSGEKTNLRYSVSNVLLHCSSNNEKKTVIAGQGYVQDLAANSGYTLEGATVTITMGGVDVSTYYANGRIAIPNVTGNIVITATAVPSAPAYTNQIPISTDANGNIFNGTGYQDDSRINSSKNVVSFTGASAIGFIPVHAGDIIYLSAGCLDRNWSQNAYCNIWVVESDKSTTVTGFTASTIGTATMLENIVYDSNGYITQFKIKSTTTAAAYIRFTLKGSASGAIITVNEEITD